LLELDELHVQPFERFLVRLAPELLRLPWRRRLCDGLLLDLRPVHLTPMPGMSPARAIMFMLH
jgi:hypothetical protein